jgi:hypothetical protein
LSAPLKDFQGVFSSYFVLGSHNDWHKKHRQLRAGKGLDNYAQGAKFAKDEEFIIGKIGSAFLPRKDVDRKPRICASRRSMRLFANNPGLKRESIDALIVVTQNGDEEGLPHTAAIVQDKLGLPTHVAALIFPWAVPGMSTASTR